MLSDLDIYRAAQATISRYGAGSRGDCDGAPSCSEMGETPRTPRWASLLSWVVPAVVWLWLFIDTTAWLRLVSSRSDLGDADLMISGLLGVVVATVMAALALFLVRLIGRGLG